MKALHTRILFVVAAIAAGTVVVHAGDILRGGANNSNAQRNATARANSGADAAAIARRTAQDRLARTTRVVEALRQGSSASAAAAAAASVPGGLVPGGLVVAGGANARWDGAALPQQNGSSVNIVQNAAQAVLHWESFNVGRGTVLNFDQSAGGTDAGKWIAFNRVVGASTAPSRILGSIKAQGQVYVINQNGVIFGAGSQVNTRTLVASALPINDNLINQGLLNNRDAQFLFSALPLPGGSDGTPAFTPPAPPASGRYGDVVVEPGAILRTLSSSDGNGGRIMLVGANVKNSGLVSTPGGQAILAAGLQVGIQAHRQDDPSLRGLDVWVGNVGTYAGRVTNAGLVEAPTGSILVVGKNIEQLGALDSSTSVALNGRIDLIAAYNAVGYPDFDAVSTSFRPAFLNQSSGTIEFGPGSVVRVLPDYASLLKAPGTSLPQNSQINITGLGIRFQGGSILQSPSGNVNIRAGIWPFQDTNGDGLANEAGITQQIVSGSQKLLLSKGQIYVDSGALLDVSGSTSAFAPLSQAVQTVQLRGSELADSPLLRNSSLRAINLVVDLRRSGVYGGREWIGTPLGDLTGLLNIIERDIAQLTSRGGSITLSAGDSVVVAGGATVDVSGGYVTNEGGRVQTSRLMRGRHMIPVDNATPDVTYDSIYTGQSTARSEKWGVERTYSHALAPLGGYMQKEYVEGASGGTLSVNAPSMILDGDLRGSTIKGPRQLDAPPKGGTISLAFQGEQQVSTGGTSFVFINQSPTPPEIRMVQERQGGAAPGYNLVSGEPAALPSGLRGVFEVPASWYSDEGGGFGNIEIANADGDFSLPRGMLVEAPVGGSLVVQARNVNIDGALFVPGGTIGFTAYNFSPFEYELLSATGALANVPAPAVQPGRGVIRVGEGAVLSVAGLFVDERPTATTSAPEMKVLDGGSIALEGYSIELLAGSFLDASGGVWAKPAGDIVGGDGGSISLLSGRDPELSTSVGGRLVMDGWVQAYSLAKGGSLTVQSNLIQIGGGSAPEGALVIEPSFFQQGGFTEYELIGLGGRNAAGGFLPGVRVASGTVIEPRADSWVRSPFARFPEVFSTILAETAARHGDAAASALAASMRASIARHSVDQLEGAVYDGGRAWGLRAMGKDLLRPYLKPYGLREPTSITLRATGYDDPFTTDRIEAIGIVLLEEGSRILTDPTASVTLGGDYVQVLGEISAPAGTIEIAGRSSFRLPSDISPQASFALPTVHIGPNARLSTAGTAVLLPDPFGRRSGILYPGGTISISGNILAESGAVLDVSGASAVFDFHPTRLGIFGQPFVPNNAGVNTMPWAIRSMAVRVDSDGGLIELEGGQFLYSDATLLGRAGGPAAMGGRLAVSSGRFYSANEDRTSADINLIAVQDGSAAAFGDTANLLSVMSGVIGGSSPEGALNAAFLAGSGQRGIGFFAIDQFHRGGFDSLDLGFVFNENATPIPFGGNVEFRGSVQINARGAVRVAGGGVIQAQGLVQINAPYVVVGQEFRPPLNPDDPFIPFRRFEVATGSTPQHFFSPTTGTGSLRISASVIDIGTLTTTGIGSAFFTAENGDIRGNGILSVAGDIVLRAAQVYPTTLATFDIFAYDPPGGVGSVTIQQSGSASLPLSAGGALRIFASQITQSGTLRAPLGSIVLGWDGLDTNPATPAVDQPFNAAVGSAASVPVTTLLTLTGGSVTSVSGIDPVTGRELLFPYGLSPDGLTWIDPRGVDTTVSGLSSRGVSLLGNTIDFQNGALVDLRGGGELLAYRWIPGVGGSVDILGSATSEWQSTASYGAGQLVFYNGKTWSARVDIDPLDFAISPRPAPSRFWAEVPESYAILPDFAGSFAPFNAFNTGVNSGRLAGDPGFVPGSLRFGERITLADSVGALSAGTYTLLPRRYGVFPGAYLVIPQEGTLTGSATPVSTFYPELSGSAGILPTALREEGSTYVSGTTSNLFRPTGSTGLLTRFEVVPPDILASRAQYELYSATSFLTEAAVRLGLDARQQLPVDSADLLIQGNTGLTLQGRVLSGGTRGGRGARIDVSSFSDIAIVGANGAAPAPGTVVLDPRVLSSWGAESLLIGGVRTQTAAGATVTVRSANLLLDAPGQRLSGAEVVLVSSGSLEMTSGSSLISSGGMGGRAQNLILTGDGALLRVSADVDATVTRSGLTGSTAPLLTIRADSLLQGSSVYVESTYATNIDPTTLIVADTLTLSSGQISINLEPQPGPLPGSLISPHLELEGDLLARSFASRRLTLVSSNFIDIYGAGVAGSTDLERLEILSAGIRGFNAGTGATLQAGEVLLANPRNVAVAAAVPPTTGSLSIDADIVRLGQGNFRIEGFGDAVLTGASGTIAEATGRLNTTGSLTFETPVFVTARGAQYNISAAGDLALLDTGATSTVEAGAGGTLTFEGESVLVENEIIMPSGFLALRARTGGLTVGGTLHADGFSQKFHDVTKYADAGRIELQADSGNISLLAGSSVTVAAAAAGGKAGTLVVRAPGGVFDADGSFSGAASGTGASGSFVLDAGTVADFGDLSDKLDTAQFFEERNLRIRNGDVTIAGTQTVRKFVLSADGGGILVTGNIDASGSTGGWIELVSRDSLTLASGAVLDVSADRFNSAGKGGHVLLEAGAAVNGVPNTSAVLDIQSGSTIDLSVAEFAAGSYTTPGSSAFHGRFTGTLHLRAPRTGGTLAAPAGNGVNISSLAGNIVDASSVIVEGYKVYTAGVADRSSSPTTVVSASGQLSRLTRDTIDADNEAFISVAEAGLRASLLSAAPNAAGLDAVLVIAPGVEIINPTGSLTLGTANTAAGSTNLEARSAADWDLSQWRYGTRSAPGVLTLRARGDVVLNNTLSDGFNPISTNTLQEFRDVGHSSMWLASLQSINTDLPVNTQSWSYRIATGADLSGAGFRSVLSVGTLDSVEPGRGSLLVGEFYPAVPNTATSGTAAAIGANGQTADTIRVSTTDADRGTRFEVLRTGTGNIDIAAGRDVQLRNPFATIYTAGIGIQDNTRIFQAGDFVAPVVEPAITQGTLGAVQQSYSAYYAMAGGSLNVTAGNDIGRVAINFTGTTPVGTPFADTSRQIPTNWLYRRGLIDPATGRFASINELSGLSAVIDYSTSTTWWVDYSNFFQGFGALGGGNIQLTAGRDVVNADAAIPTSARMAGQDPTTGGDPSTRQNLIPDADNLLEYGGGDLVVEAGRNIDGGTFYVERGGAVLAAGAEITTNQARSPSRGNIGLASGPAAGTSYLDPLTWQAVTLYGGRSSFDVSARGNVLIGPASAAFLAPQGLNNKFWYKSQFQTIGEDAAVDVRSFGGSVTHRLSITLPGSSGTTPALAAAYQQTVAANIQAAGYYRPWLRLAESNLARFSTMATVGLPTLRSVAFGGDLSVIGSLNLFPSPTGELELLASGSFVGLNRSGVTTTTVNGQSTSVTAWTAASINLSDSNPAAQPGIASPLGFQQAAGVTSLAAVRTSTADPFAGLSGSFEESGSFTGVNALIDRKSALHATTPVHLGNPNPVRIYAGEGDITGVTLFSAKKLQAFAGRDITDIAFYLQHPNAEDISIVSAGRDIIPFNENSPLRAVAADISRGNFIVDAALDTVVNDAVGQPISTKALSGDIQIGGRGFLEVLAGRDVDLGTGANFVDGTGTGITSIGRLRNPFLPFEGAGIIVLAGVGGEGGGPAIGLSGSTLDLEEFEGDTGQGTIVGDTDEHRAIAALNNFFSLLQRVGQEASETGDYSEGDEAINRVFGTTGKSGSLLTRARDIRTASGGGVTVLAPAGGITMASDIFGNPLTPPGIVTEFGGAVNILTRGDVDIGQARIFTLRGGDLTIWSIAGDIAAGNAPKTVVTAPPTRVSIDATSADVQTDLGGLATGGGIGVLASVEGVEPGSVSLIAPLGTVDAGDAGIRATGDIQIAAAAVVNADNISAGGTSTGVPAAPAVAAPNIGGLTSASATSGASSATAEDLASQARPSPTPADERPSDIQVQVLGYGGGEEEEDDESGSLPAE